MSILQKMGLDTVPFEETPIALGQTMAMRDNGKCLLPMDTNTCQNLEGDPQWTEALIFLR